MKKIIPLSVLTLGVVGAASAQVLYDNTLNDNGGYSINGAILQNGGNTIVTNTDFEEIHLASGYAGLNLANVSMDLYNGNSAPVFTQVYVQLYNDDSNVTAGAPGTSFFNYDGSLTLNHGVTRGFGFDLLNTSSGNISHFFPLPTDGNLWVSIAFTDPATGDVAAQAALLNHLSPAVGGPPTVGTTPGVDTYAYSSNDTLGNGFFGVTDPQQVVWANGANFGVHIDGTTATPEPFTMGLGLAGIGLAVRRRMKAKASK